MTLERADRLLTLAAYALAALLLLGLTFAAGREYGYQEGVGDCLVVADAEE